MYIGFAFFLLCVGYVSLRRTPAFIKQPVYALLHMKQGGEPFTPQGRVGRGRWWLDGSCRCSATKHHTGQEVLVSQQQ
jgi:hypothetical protein